MEKDLLKHIITKVISRLKDNALTAVHPQPVPIGISNRHVHLSMEHMEILFGTGYNLNVSQSISQPGQFAAVETVNLAGPKGCIEKVRILGPVRKETQVEIMRSDKYKLGVAPPIRESGDIKNSAGISIVGPKGSVYINDGLIISKRHIHMTPRDAEIYGVKDGQIVQVRTGSGRGLIFDQVAIRVREDFALEFHIDMDEANAAEVENSDMAGLLIINSMPCLPGDIASASGSEAVKLQDADVLSLVTEEKVRKAWKDNKPLYIKKESITTPLAKDAIKELGIKLITM